MPYTGQKLLRPGTKPHTHDKGRGYKGRGCPRPCRRVWRPLQRGFVDAAADGDLGHGLVALVGLGSRFIQNLDVVFPF